MADRSGIFSGEDPFAISRQWLEEAAASEANDPNAAALASVDANGLPNLRIVLLKEINALGFVFYTNYDSRKGQELQASGLAALNLHWKSLGRQIRVRGSVSRTEPETSDAYFASRSLGSRIGAWSSRQSAPLGSRSQLVKELAQAGEKLGSNPARPENWGGFLIAPVEVEFWADGEFRLHDRFRWSRKNPAQKWDIQRLYP